MLSSDNICDCHTSRSLVHPPSARVVPTTKINRVVARVTVVIRFSTAKDNARRERCCLWCTVEMKVRVRTLKYVILCWQPPSTHSEQYNTISSIHYMHYAPTQIKIENLWSGPATGSGFRARARCDRVGRSACFVR